MRRSPGIYFSQHSAYRNSPSRILCVALSCDKSWKCKHYFIEILCITQKPLRPIETMGRYLIIGHSSILFIKYYTKKKRVILNDKINAINFSTVQQGLKTAFPYVVTNFLSIWLPNLTWVMSGYMRIIHVTVFDKLFSKTGIVVCLNPDIIQGS